MGFFKRKKKRQPIYEDFSDIEDLEIPESLEVPLPLSKQRNMADYNSESDPVVREFKRLFSNLRKQNGLINRDVDSLILLRLLGEIPLKFYSS